MCCVLAALYGLGPGFAQDLHVIGTGTVVGLYYPVGGAVSFIINAQNPDLLFTVKVTAGSVDNIGQLEEGEISLALAQSDVLYRSYQDMLEGVGNGQHDTLRALMGLHPEPLHLVCRKDVGARDLRDLRGKRVNLGDEGSGVLTTARTVLNAYRIDETSDLDAFYLSPEEAPSLLAEGALDCFFFTVGIGGAAIQATAAAADIDLVPLDGPELMPLMRDSPYYSFVEVPANTYPGVEERVTLFGVKAFLVSTDTLPEATAYKVVQSLLGGFDTLRQTYPLLETLEQRGVLEGLGVPLHPGAERAYREAGLID